MTADDLMRLVSRYVEACDDLGDGLFEKPLSTTDALHAKATELHSQILAEAYRLQAVESALTLAVQAMRAPLDDWKGELERKALDAAHAALGPNVGVEAPLTAPRKDVNGTD